MTPSHASHICPKCREARNQEAFRRKNGELAGWCSWCRDAHRQRLINLRKRKETVAVGMALNAPEVVAKAEGYAGHPLATLLALSHIAGAKRALAIRDGRSWRGKKAWGEYYRAKRELEAMLAPKNEIDAHMAAGHDHGLLIPCHSLCPKSDADLAAEALHRLQANSLVNGTSEMSDEEIDAAIKRDP